MTEVTRITELSVSVVLALPSESLQVTVKLPIRSTVADAIDASKLELHEAAPTSLAGSVGVWNQPCELTQELTDGDRVELYRRLTVDPMVARRRRAERRTRLQKQR